MSLPRMTIALERAIQKSMTRPSLSVHHTSFLWALVQELVRSTNHRFVVPRRLPSASTIVERLRPCFPRSTGLLSTFSPPYGAFVMQQSTPRPRAPDRWSGRRLRAPPPPDRPSLLPLSTHRVCA